MIIYIPQNLDPYNTHLKNLVLAYSTRGVEVVYGFEKFASPDFIPDVIHIHFLEGLLSRIRYDETFFFEKLDFYKKNGTRFIYTFHDAKPHSRIKKLDYTTLFDRFLSYVDIFIHHGELSIAILSEMFPRLCVGRHIVCHHGDYLNDMGGFHKTKEQARAILKFPSQAKIILIFGQLQYKNTAFAEEVVKMVRQKYPDTILLMAGVFPFFKYNRINVLYYKLNNSFFNKFRKYKIRLHGRFTQYETYLIFNSADLVFLPHKSGLTTGVIPMSATLGKPFVYPNIGVFEEQARNCLAEKFEVGNIDQAYSAIDNILKNSHSSFDNTIWLENNNWERHVDIILENLNTLIS